MEKIRNLRPGSPGTLSTRRCRLFWRTMPPTMALEDELESLDRDLAELEFRARDDGVLGGFLDGRDAATLNRVRSEAKALIDEALGFANDFSLKLHFGSANSLASVQECRGQIQGALN